MNIFSLRVTFAFFMLLASHTVMADGTLPTKVEVDETRKVVMFSSTFCPACGQAKTFFKEHDIAFMEFDIEKSTVARRYFDRLGGRGTPFLLINNRRLHGFSEPAFWNYYRIEGRMEGRMKE